MANHAWTKEAKRNEQKRDFFCIVRDAFRCFAQRSSSVLGSAWAFCGAVLVIVVWLVTGPTFHFSDTWQLIINTATTVITFLMVFLIQNTQNRDAKAMHLKLDELIRAVKGARNQLVDLENLSDDELKNLEAQFQRLRKEAESSPTHSDNGHPANCAKSNCHYSGRFIAAHCKVTAFASNLWRMTSVWELANPQLQDLAVYEPGKPIEETARELGVDPSTIIKLASNENPLGPSPKALQAMRAALENAHLYPDGSGFYLRKALAAKLSVAPENVILGNGSNEVIEFLGHAFLNPGDDVITCQYAFIVYKLLATAFGVRTIETPSPDYQQNLDATLDAITAKTRIIFIPNPNNPTGTLISQRAIDSFMSRVPDSIIVVFDEAYFEFLDDPPDTLRFVRDGRNVVVLRTFSKIHGLAGVRIGYAIAPPDMTEVLHKTRQPFNVNSIAHAGAIAALDDEAHLRETKRVIDEGRAYLQEQFAEMQIPFVPAAANFLMVNVGDGCAVFQKLLQRKIIVRPLKGYGLPEWVRISVGTMEENRQLIAALRDIMRSH